MNEGKEVTKVANAQEPVTFEINDKVKDAIRVLAGDRKVKLDGRVEGGKLRLVGIKILPFGACNSAFCPVEEA